MNVIKRDGRKQDFNKERIVNAVVAAFKDVDGEITQFARDKARDIANYIYNLNKDKMSVEEIQDIVEEKLMASSRKDVAKSYIIYRNERTKRRGNIIDGTVEEIALGINEYWATENSNKNPKTVTTQRDYFAGAISTDITMRKLLTPDIVDAHEKGIIHFHDSDYFAQLALNNCCLINLDDMLQNGTVINGMMIEKPHKFITACTIATQIILGVSSSQYGGCTVTLSHLAPFVRDSFIKYLKKSMEYIEKGDKTLEDICNDPKKWQGYDFIKSNYNKNYQYSINCTKDEINAGIQTFNYQINSMTNTNGQSPFVSVNMYLGETDEYKEELAWMIEEVLNQRIEGFKNEKGIWITPAFPKLLYVLEEDNIYEDSKYFYLTELAAKCTAKRMVPDYISEKIMLEYKGDCYPCMGCRSFLTPDRHTLRLGNLSRAKNYTGKNQYYGRFNQGVVTINLADIALSSKRDEEKFWELFEERTELCHKALRLRHERLLSITSDAAPLLWQHGAFARLNKGESVKELLYHGYSTISLGYAALYECVLYMTGESHTQERGKEFGLKVMQALNDKCNEWKKAEDIDYSIYGTPIEATTYKFARCLKERFGIIEGITDHNYITNSYHINVRENITAFDKLKKEAEFQKLSPGGAISYIEINDLQNNIEAILSIITFIYDNIMYAELNTKSDYCMGCGYDGEIEIVTDENGKLIWKCPNCGNTNQDTMNVTRRTCGYLGSNYWNQGRTEEIKDRVLHVSVDGIVPENG